LLIAVCQLFNTFCSKQLYPEQSFQNIESHAEKKKLKDFLDAGNGKELKTNNTSANEIIKPLKNISACLTAWAEQR